MKFPGLNVDTLGLPIYSSPVSLTALDVSPRGETSLDLSGSWASDLRVSIDAGAGSISLRLPKDVGVRVVVDAGVGTVNASGLTKDGNVYTNDTKYLMLRWSG
jgi:hypothetical protein